MHHFFMLSNTFSKPLQSQSNVKINFHMMAYFKVQDPCVHLEIPTMSIIDVTLKDSGYNWRIIFTWLLSLKRTPSFFIIIEAYSWIGIGSDVKYVILRSLESMSQTTKYL